MKPKPGHTDPTDNHASDANRHGAAPGRADVILLTGLSGSGRATALKWFEDSGYEAVDNLPLSLVVPLLRGRQTDLQNNPANQTISTKVTSRKVAICLDVRSRGFTSERLFDLKQTLREHLHLYPFILYLECDDEQLLRRFTETRRRHPLAEDRPIRDGISAERAFFAPIRGEADLLLDTTGWSPHDFRHRLETVFKLDQPHGISLTLMSFSYKNGLPREADLVFDVRFLNNPHWHEELRPMDGRDVQIANFIEQDPDFTNFFAHLCQLLMPLWSRFRAEGKSYVTVAFGCSGGRHRSVFVAEKLAKHLKNLNLSAKEHAQKSAQNSEYKANNLGTIQWTPMELTLVHRDLSDNIR